jgi:phage/plasmid-like protein (TIGR03299 family)
MPAYFDTGFTVREPAWHGLGAVLDDYPRHIDDARELAGLTWEPELVPVYQRQAVPLGVYPDGSLAEREDYVAVPNARLIQRSDTKAVIGHGVSDRYVPILNKQMFEVLEALVDQGLKIETAGSVKGGAQVWALAYLDEPYYLPNDDSASLPYIGVVNSHDGKSAMRAMATQVRIVCWNTIQAAYMDSQRHGQYWEFRHKGGVQDRIDEAKRAISGMRTEADQWVDLANDLLGMRVDQGSYSAFVAEFIPEPPAAVVSDRVRNNIAEARRMFHQLYQGEQNAAVNNTALALVNTAIEYLDHARGYRNSDTYLGRTVLKPEPLKAKAIQIARGVCGVA